jgi:hypothetical protein
MFSNVRGWAEKRKAQVRTASDQNWQLVLALRKTRFMDNLFYLCDNQSLLKAVQKWTGEGPKQTMANAPDADILREIIELLKMRVQNGAATFLVKSEGTQGRTFE